MKKITTFLLVGALTSGCAPVRDGPSPNHGFSTAAQGVGHLMLSPFMILAGLIEGIASLPYFIAHNVHDLNRELVNANASITLGDTYESAYGRDIEDVSVSGDTGVVFHQMKDATPHFQRILRQYGVHHSERYILTAIRTADKEGFTLYAVVYRPAKKVRVVGKRDAFTIDEYSEGERPYYRPYRTDEQGRALDTVIDWAGVSRDTIRTQKGQAILMTLAANSILNGKRSPDYWEVERRWIAGDYRGIAQDRMDQLKQRMGLDTSPPLAGRVQTW